MEIFKFELMIQYSKGTVKLKTCCTIIPNCREEVIVAVTRSPASMTHSLHGSRIWHLWTHSWCSHTGITTQVNDLELTSPISFHAIGRCILSCTDAQPQSSSCRFYLFHCFVDLPMSRWCKSIARIKSRHQDWRCYTFIPAASQSHHIYTGGSGQISLSLSLSLSLSHTHTHALSREQY